MGEGGTDLIIDDKNGKTSPSSRRLMPTLDESMLAVTTVFIVRKLFCCFVSFLFLESLKLVISVSTGLLVPYEG